MSIFHHTNIKTLALILQSKRIRFTRIDSQDDIKEIAGIPEKIKSYFYISCWTEEEEENLSLWSLYTQMNGVRIELNKKMFNEYTYSAGDYGNWGFGKETTCPLTIDEIRTDDYLVSNPFWLDDGFYTNIIYDKDYQNLKKSSVTNHQNGININHAKNLVRYKNPIWGFQQESRFYLVVLPLPPLETFNGDRLKQMENIGSGDLKNELNHIDVCINPAVLDKIVVRLHPNCDIADKIIIESLLEKFTKNGKIEESHLNETYRNKNKII